MRYQSQHYVLGFMFKSQPPVIAYEMVEECRSTLKKRFGGKVNYHG